MFYGAVLVVAVHTASASPLPLTYTEEINDIVDLILERCKQIVHSHQEEIIAIPDLDITFKQGTDKPGGTIEAQDGGFRGLDTIKRAGDAFIIRKDEDKLSLVALMKMNTMSYYYNEYRVHVNETEQSGSLNVVIKENLIKMDLHLDFTQDCSFELTDLNIKIANNFTVQMSLLEVQPGFYQDIVNWACENYLTVIADSVRSALYNDINQALHDLEICHFILSPSGLADLLPKKRLDLPFFSLTIN